MNDIYIALDLSISTAVIKAIGTPEPMDFSFPLEIIRLTLEDIYA